MLGGGTSLLWPVTARSSRSPYGLNAAQNGLVGNLNLLDLPFVFPADVVVAVSFPLDKDLGGRHSQRPTRDDTDTHRDRVDPGNTHTRPERVLECTTPAHILQGIHLNNDSPAHRSGRGIFVTRG